MPLLFAKPSPRSRQLLVPLLGWLALVVFAHMLDGIAFPGWFVADDLSRGVMESKDWYRLLRITGYLPTWLIVGGILLLRALADSRHGRDRSGGLPLGVALPLGAAISGGLSELAKIIIRRGRPIDTAGEYIFIPYSDGFFDTSRLGLASSHAGVAFGAAFVLIAFVPRSGWIVLPLAIGCGLTRVWSGQHFVSDIAGGAVIAWCVARFLVPRPQAGRPNARGHTR